jgi:ubiquinone biosynthesis protein
LDRAHVLGSIRVVDLVDEFAEYTLREVDFLQEGATADAVRAETRPPAKVPEIHWELTTRRLLVAEFVDGLPLSELVRLSQAGDPDPFATLLPGVDGRSVLETLADACLRQLFVTGHFHGDPHPANILIEPGGTVVFVDFGIFGELTPDQRRTLGSYVEALARGDVAGAYRRYSTLVLFSEETDTVTYRRETMSSMATWLRASGDPTAPVEEKITARYQGEMLDVMRHHHVRIQHDQLLFWRALAVLDSTAHQLPVDFDLLAAVRRFFVRRRPILSALAPVEPGAAIETAALARKALGGRPGVSAWRTTRGRAGVGPTLALAVGGLSLLIAVLSLTGAVPGVVPP